MGWIKRLRLTIRRRSRTRIGGEHLAAHGRATRGEEFVGTREWEAGDEPRALSLKLSIRRGVPMVVDTTPEWKACLVFLIDVSRSMAPVIGRLEDFLRLIGACLRFEDPPVTGWFLFADKLLDDSPGFRTGQPSLRRFLIQSPCARADANEILMALRHALGVKYRGALVMMISDFTMASASGEIIRMMGRDYDFVPVLIRDRAGSPPLPGLCGGCIVVEDVEGGRAPVAIDRFAELPSCEEFFREHGATTMVLRSDASPEEWARSFVLFFEKRERRARRGAA
ncbi:MAG: DUF58 domain-containing protein [Patescibacteria group bacterium]